MKYKLSEIGKVVGGEHRQLSNPNTTQILRFLGLRRRI